MPKRFSRYKFALKAVNGEAPSGSPLAKYKEVATGERTVTYERNTAMNPGRRQFFYVIPFGENGAVYYLVGVGSRALAQAEGILGGLDITGLEPAETLPENARTTESDKYTPAAATVFRQTGVGAPDPSRITGVSYRKRLGASYSFPFGRLSATASDTNTFKGRALAIKEQVATVDNASVTFRPEILSSF